MGIVTGIKKLVGINAASRFPGTETERVPVQHPSEGRVIASETIYPSPGGPVPTPHKNSVPIGPYVGSLPWDFSETTAEQRAHELKCLVNFPPEGNREKQSQNFVVGPEEPHGEIIEFTPAAWDLAEELGLDPDWIVSVVEPSGKRGNMLVKDVRRAAAIRDAEQERQRRTELAEQERQTRARLEAGNGGSRVSQAPETDGNVTPQKTSGAQIGSLLDKYNGLDEALTTTTEIESW